MPADWAKTYIMWAAAAAPKPLPRSARTKTRPSRLAAPRKARYGCFCCHWCTSVEKTRCACADSIDRWMGSNSIGPMPGASLAAYKDGAVKQGAVNFQHADSLPEGTWQSAPTPTASCARGGVSQLGRSLALLPTTAGKPDTVDLVEPAATQKQKHT